jgi:excisionase family DNA binding protein
MARKPANLDPLDGKVTISITEAAEVLGISRNTAYAAAARGELPVVTFGTRKLVPVAALRRKLGSPTA